jgi:hypothetical protein
MAASDDLNIDDLLLIVVGANLRAEMADRPLAYRLRDRILAWQEQAGARDDVPALTPVICTDLWYLNNRELMERPTIAIGDPAVNAACAYLSTRLPTALVIEGTLRVHLDPEFIDVQACLWGVSNGATASAVDVFVERHMDTFLREAAGSKA